MSDYAKATGQPRRVTLAGVEYSVPRMAPSILGELDAYLKSAVPDPRVEAKKFMEGLPDAVAIHIWDQATADAAYWPPRTLDERGQLLLLTTPGGQAQLVYSLLRRTIAGLTREQAGAIADALSTEDVVALLEAAMPEEFSPPKDEGEATPPTIPVTASSTGSPS